MISKLFFFTLTCLQFWYAECLNYESGEGKVVDGEYALIHDYAHAVFLRVSRADKSSHVCGSSVLTQTFLLSAAHCFYEMNDVLITAFAGHEDVKMAPVSRKVSKTVLHKEFQLSTVENDIALVVLKVSLPLGRNIKRIILKKTFPRDASGTLAGWGYTDENKGPPSDFLKLAEQKVRDRRDCQYLKLRPGMLCAGSLKPTGSRPSRGDSGSGLITSKHQIIGLLSYRVNQFPSLFAYTNVSHYYYWIKLHTMYKYCNV